jgi:MYXO-CTERM domain-containing protein
MWALFFIATAAADVDGADRWLSNDNLAAGLNADGSFGNEELELGFLWDPDGPTGAMPITGDMIWVGYRWDVWSWDWETAEGEEGEEVHAAPHIENDTEIEWTGSIDNDAVSALSGEYETDAMNVQMRVVMLKRADIILQDIRYTPSEDLSTLRVGRTFDPDQDHWLMDSYTTENTIGDEWVSSASSVDERAIGLAGASGSGRVGTPRICSWCDTPSEMADSTGSDGTADTHPNVLLSLGAVSAGESVRARFVYAFAVGGEAAGIMAAEALDLNDIDNDGLSPEEGDCRDLDPLSYPGADERFDGIDNDCDGEIDEDTLEGDDDGDGFSEAEGDCDDSDPDVFPGAEPVDGVTNADCDGVSDTPPEDTGLEPEDTGGFEDTGTAPDEQPPEETADDTDIAADGPIVIGKHPSGCTCSTGGRTGGLGWFMLLMIWLRRREET